MLDLEMLPDQLAGLYMKRYEMTFPDDEADSTNPLDQFDHTRPMLARSWQLAAQFLRAR